MGLRSLVVNQLDLSLWVVVRGVGRIGLNEVGCGKVWEVVGGCGRLWCGRLWESVGVVGCGRLW